MERFFQISAVILGGIAAYFLWTGNADGAFAAAVFGAVSFFLSVRVRVKARLNETERERLAELEAGELNELEEAESSPAFETDFESVEEDLSPAKRGERR